jgi:hypothetical protein
MDFVDLAAFG